MALHHHMFAALLVLTSCRAGAADAPTAQVSAVSDLASLLEGEFTTTPAGGDQTGAAPQTRTLYDQAKRVQVPALGRDVVYVELRETGPSGPLLSQTLYALKLDDENDHIVMTSYRFSHPEAFAEAYTNIEILAKLAPSDLKTEPDGCKIAWHKTETGFDGLIETGSCKNPPPNSDKMPVMSVSKTGLSDKIENAPAIFRRLR